MPSRFQVTEQKVTRKLRYKLTKYVLLDDQLYYKTVYGVLLKYLNQEEAKVLMGEVHEGICGAHQSAYKMKWIIHRTGLLMNFLSLSIIGSN